MDIWAAAGSLFLIIIGLWKWIVGGAEERRKKEEAKIKETKDAIKNGDTGTITSNLS